MVTPEHRAQGRRCQRPCNGNSVCPRHQPVALVLAAIARLHHQTCPPLPQRLTRLGVAADRLPGAPRQAQEVSDTPGQPGPYGGRKLRRENDGAACRACKSTPGCCGFYHIGPRAQPHSPSGQPCKKVRHHHPLRPQHEPQHQRALAPLPRNDAAPKRAGFLLLIRSLRHVRERTGVRSGRAQEFRRCRPPAPRAPQPRTSAPAPP